MSPLTPLPVASQLDQQFSRPSWADPQFFLAANDFEAQTVALAPNVVTQIAANDPKRWILGIVKPNPTTAPVRVWPNGANTAIGFQLGVSDTGVSLNLFSWGPVVCYDWYAVSAAAATLDIWTTKIGPKG